MRRTAKAWSDYADRLSRLNTKAGQLMRAYLERYGAEDTPALIAYASALVDKYGEGSAELACQMYDAMAEAAGLTLPAAEPAAPAAYGEVAKAVNGTKHSPALLQSAVSRLVKQAGADTTLQNAIRDGAEFAWVPHGDTCAFCLMLASRGWQKAGKRTLKNGHAEHIHANCDCEYAVRFDASTTVAGYDPEQYLAAYESAEGRTYQEKLNSLRRAHYAEKRKKITAQKRAAYLIKKRSTAGEIDDLREQHRVPDRKEYDRFRRILGTKAPKTFAEFQNVKYNIDSTGWDALQNELKDTLIRADIRAGKYDLTVNPEKQARHLRDSGSYIPGRSFLTISMEELQDIVTRYAGTGEIARDGRGGLRECISLNRRVGTVIRRDGSEVPAFMLKLHYSKTGVHAVPFAPQKEDTQ